MKGTKYTTEKKVLKRAQEAIGIPLKKIDKTGRLSKGKGAIGTVIEESWFGYSPNSESEPDFPEASVELKVIPYIKGKNGKIRAKERLVCNIINYMKEYDKDFNKSSFWHKNKKLLLMSYKHIKGVEKGEYKIDKAVLFSFPKEDCLIIENDWKIIMDKVRRGEAHLISERDTLYLAACTKGANSSSVRQQPFSDIPAKQRAYSLKSSYMTQILNRYIFGNAENERVIKDPKQLRTRSFEDIIIEKLRPYFGKTQKQLKKYFGVKTSSKNLNEVLLAKMLKIKGKISHTDEFKKANIVPKTIRVKCNGKIKENMSLPTSNFKELSNEKKWEKSSLYQYLSSTKFLFIVFKETNNGEYVFERVKLWQMSEADLQKIKSVWKKSKNIIQNGDNDGKYNFPRKSENKICHVRPHANNSDDTFCLPNGKTITKQSFWLNNSYIEKQIKEKK